MNKQELDRILNNLPDISVIGNDTKGNIFYVLTINLEYFSKGGYIFILETSPEHDSLQKQLTDLQDLCTRHKLFEVKFTLEITSTGTFSVYTKVGMILDLYKTSRVRNKSQHLN